MSVTWPEVLILSFALKLGDLIVWISNQNFCRYYCYYRYYKLTIGTIDTIVTIVYLGGTIINNTIITNTISTIIVLYYRPNRTIEFII